LSVNEGNFKKPYTTTHQKGGLRFAFCYFCAMVQEQRYFIRLAYHGGPFVGWQAQPNGASVQTTIETALSTLFQSSIKVMGCGRTDAGVHASQFYLHFDAPKNLPEHFADRLNKMVGKDIAIREIIPVHNEAHVRFDAHSRAYTYYLSGQKDPFTQGIHTYYPQFKSLDFELMQEAVRLLLNYKEFTPFCKTNSDAKTMFCTVTRSEWIKQGDHLWEFHIESNRFLRGMVRLIVGMSIKVASGKLSLDIVKKALDEQSALAQSYSAPPQGLFLSKVRS